MPSSVNNLEFIYNKVYDDLNVIWGSSIQNIIKSIRHYSGFGQQEFAKHLGVSFATVNQWENGQAIPNKLAQLKLYDYCKEKNIPVYDFTIQKIKEEKIIYFWKKNG